MDRKNWLQFIFECVIFIIFIKTMFSLSILAGLGFIASFVGSIYSGLMLKRSFHIGFIVGGTLLAYVASMIFSNFLDSAKSGEWISAVIILVLAGYIWLKAFFIKKGKI